MPRTGCRGEAALLLARSLTRLERLVRQGQKLTAELVIHLSEVERRKLQLVQACSSMFGTCTERLHLSESSAYKHIRAARLGRQFPLVLEALAEGKVHLTAISLLSSELTEENHRELLEAASHRSKRDLELLLAERRPKPDVRSMVRMLSEPRPSREIGQATTSATTAAATAATTASVTPLGSRRFKVQFTASASLHDKLRRAQALMRRELLDGDLAGIVERALDLLLGELGRRKLAQTDRPRSPKPKGECEPAAAARSRHIPNAIKRAVYKRDGMRCAFVDELGRRCSETGLLELHHRQPFARGGEDTAQNLELRCWAHHLWETERDWGTRFIEERIQASQAQAGREPAMAPRS